ncbi:MAG: nuclear transport factor 2 family protein [Hyphomonas sp.]|nr:nuclear transport factor 2 family protein [Hyphomonas sp.]
MPSNLIEMRSSALALLAKVKYAKDDEDEVRFATCWTPDARLEIETNGQLLPALVGRRAILDFYRSVWSSGGHGKGGTRETHVAEYPDLVLRDDGTLIARHTVSFFYVCDGQPTLRGFGMFTDTILFTDGDAQLMARRSLLTRTK